MIAFRFFLGVGVGGSMAIIYSYMGEFVTTERRSRWLATITLGWIIGGVVAAGIGWLSIPHETYAVGSAKVPSWRVYIVVCASTALLLSAPFWFVPRIPRALLKQGKIQKAKEILKMIRRVNSVGLLKSCRSKDDFYAVDIELDFSPVEEKFEVEKPKVLDFRAKIRRVQKTAVIMVKQLLQLFKPLYLKRSLTINVVAFTFTFGYYGFLMWLPSYFELVHSSLHCNYSVVNNCTNETTLLDDIYFKSFISQLSTIPFQLFAVWIIKKLGSKRLLCQNYIKCLVASLIDLKYSVGVSLFLSSAFVFAFALMSAKDYGTLLMSCLFASVSIWSWSATDILSVELFPSSLRATALGMEEGVGRIGSFVGNLLFGALAGSHLLVPLFVSASLIFVGGIVSLTLPASADTPSRVI
eukprot:m.91663 g.91663  ORF g.91663 m.91663 type:complete len:411 (+) comp36704_c0_seq1:476-1708(+)